MKRLPRAGELLAIEQMPSKAGGCAANVAIDLARQGIAVDVCGCVGGDASAEVVLQSLAAAGVGCGEIRRLQRHPTGKTVILLVEGEDRRYIHVFGANAAFDVGQLRRDWIDGLKVFYLGGLLAMPGICMEQLAEVLAYCRGRGITTVVDVVVPQDQPGLDQLPLILPYTDYFLPNDDEARRLTGVAESEEQIEAFLRHGAGTVVITCGAQGAIAATGRHRWRAESYRVESIDPSGSGDAFATGVVTGILRRWDMAQTLRYAAALGASATTAVGTTDGVFTAEAAQAFIDQDPLTVHHCERE
jgi:sugar/nucleoside kinase (ribokinase family)